jgi:choline dehydrogenase
VGQNLQDHLCIYIQHECSTQDSLAAALRQPKKTMIGLQWLLTHGGPGASNHFEAGGFIRSGAGIAHPDLQYHFMPLAVGYELGGGTSQPSYQVDADGLRPESRGTVIIRSADPRAAPAVDPNYLTTEHDRRVMRDAVTLTREIFAQPAFDRFRKREIAPGPGVRSRDEIDAYVRSTAQSAYHPSCTCRMGSGPDAVVDAECRVYGVDRLRVVDASIMPSIVSGNLNAATFMIAERAADLITKQPMLPPQNAPYYVASGWQEAQR